MNLFKINPFIRYSNIHPFPIKNNTMTKTYDCRMFFVLEGEGIFYIDDKEYNFYENSFFIIRCGTKYKYTYDNNKNVKFIIFNFDFTSKYSNMQDTMIPVFEHKFAPEKMFYDSIYDNFPNPLVLHDFSSIKNPLLKINNLFINKPYLFRELSSSIFKQIIVETFQNIELTYNPSNSQLVDDILAYIRKNYTKPITNADIAAKYGYHPYHLCRLIKAATGKSLHQYLMHYRIKISQELLRTSNYSIDEISTQVGFTSSSQFSYTFKAKTGMTPTKYRTTYLKNSL